MAIVGLGALLVCACQAQQPGTLDLSFNPGTSADGIQAIAVQSDGKVLVAGNFKTFAGQSRIGLARLNSNGQLDSGFVPAMALPGAKAGLVALPNGQILVGGNSGTNSTIRRFNGDGSLDTNFLATIPGGLFTLRVIKPLANGGLLIGGNFSQVNGINRTGLALLKADGTVDEAFNADAFLQSNGTAAIDAAVVQNDGKFVIGGGFQKNQQSLGHFVARLRSDGQLDSTFSIAEASVSVLEVQLDGKILAGGSFRTVNGNPVRGLVRFQADGTLDESFAVDSALMMQTVVSIMIQEDNQIIIVGNFDQLTPPYQSYVARLNPDGSFDRSFVTPAPTSDGVPDGGTQQPDGKVVIFGEFTEVGGVGRKSLARLIGGDLTAIPRIIVNPAPVKRVEPSGGHIAYRVEALSSSNLVYQWLFKGTDIPGATNSTLNLANLQNSDSGAYTVRVTNALGSAFSPAVSLTVTSVPPNPGSIDPMFNPGLAVENYDIATVAIDSHARILVAGDFRSFDQRAAGSIVRLRPDGSIDPGFATDVIRTYGMIQTIAMAPEQKIVIGGSFSEVAGHARNGIARLNEDGSLDQNFNPSFSPNSGILDGINLVAVDDLGRILIAGGFTNVNGLARKCLVRLNFDGTLDSNFALDPAFFRRIEALAPQLDGKILIAGEFALGAAGFLERLNQDGSFDSSFNAVSADRAINTIAIDENRQIVIGGLFETVGGNTRRAIARLKTDGSIDTTFDPGAGPFLGSVLSAPPVRGINSIVLQRDGKIVAGGSFTAFGRMPASSIVRLLPSGEVDTTFVTQFERSDLPSFLSAIPSVSKIVIDPDGNPVVAGLFSNVNGVDRNGVVRLRSSAPNSIPTIFSQPSSQNVIAGDTASFGVKAIANSPLSYQWSINGIEIPGATNAVFNVASAHETDAGQYQVTISSPSGSVVSESANLTINPVPMDYNPLNVWHIREPLTGPLPNLASVTFGGDKFVAVGEQGAIAVSNDGLEWTLVESGTVENLNDIAFNHDIFLAVGNNGVLLTSTDTKSWERQTTGTDLDLKAAAFGNGMFVTVGGKPASDAFQAPHADDAYIVLASPDARNWTIQRQATAKGDLRDVAFGKGMFLAVGDFNFHTGIGQYDAYFWTSPDGLEWTQRKAIPPTAYSNVDFVNDRFLIDGAIVSFDGVTWNNLQKPPSGNSFSYGNGVYLDVARGKILFSTDAVEWVNRSLGTASNLAHSAFGNKSFVVVGEAGAILQSGPFLAVAPKISGTSLTKDKGLNILVDSVVGQTYTLEYRISLTDPLWISLVSTPGNGKTITLTDPSLKSPQRFYRVRAE